MLLAGLASGKSASISEERAHHAFHLTHIWVFCEKSIPYFESPFAGLAYVHSSESFIQDILII